MVIRPPVGAIKRASNKASSFLPLPPCPTTAMCSVSETVKLIPSRTRLPSSSAKDKLMTASSPVRGVEISGSANCKRASIIPAGWNCSTICSYLIRESSLI
jgi:hypothetical protein